MSPKKILLITYYFPPDLAAGSFRAESLLNALIVQGGTGVELELITATPSRYSSFLMAAAGKERYRGVRIRRLKVPFLGRSLPAQALRHLFFSLRLLLLLRGSRYDVVVATSSRLMTAAVGGVIARIVGARLYLDIRDIFTETLAELYPSRLFSPLHHLLRYVERTTLQSANHVNYVSKGFLPYFEHLSLSASISFHPNGVDDLFIPARSNESDGLPEVLYAGNIGEGQGLHKLLPFLAEGCKQRFRFTVIGDGGKLKQLRQECERRELTNITILQPIPRQELVARYTRANVLFLHLNDRCAFERVLPSKLFEYAATGKPILAGVSGYASQFIHEEVPGVSIFKPCDVDGAILALNGLNMSLVNRESFCKKFSRKRIMKVMANDILALIPSET